MFTVKQCDMQGNVWLKQCDDVEVSDKSGMLWIICSVDNRAVAGISGWREDAPGANSLYIMNENGATVESFKFRPSAHSSLVASNGVASSAGCEPAEPFKPNQPFIDPKTMLPGEEEQLAA